LSNDAKVITSGLVKGFSGLVAGLPVYADPLNPGGWTQTDPENSIFDNKWVIRLGMAITSSTLLVNPDQASSAYFKAEVNFSVENNQSSATDVTGLLVDSTKEKAATIEYYLYRKTDDIELAQHGQFRVRHKGIEDTWVLATESYAGDDAGVTFSINSATGQVRYTSSNITGANYEGTLECKIIKQTITPNGK